MDTLNKLKLENIVNNSDCLSDDPNAITTPPPESMDVNDDNNDDDGIISDEKGLVIEPCSTPPSVTMSLGEALQKENICPYQQTISPNNHHGSHGNRGNRPPISDESSCGTSPMSDSDSSYISNNENRKYATDPIPIPP